MSFNTGTVFQHRMRNLFLLQNRTPPVPPVFDPLYANVILLLLGDGVTGSTTFVDSSLYNRTMTPTWYIGTQPSLSNVESVFGTTSIEGGNPGTASAINTPSTSAEWGGDEWCVDGWANRRINSDYFGLGYFNNTNLNMLMKAPNNSGLWECGFVFNGAFAITSTSRFNLGVWNHFALTCELLVNTSIVRLFMNGVLEGSFSRGPALYTPMFPSTVPNPFSLGRTDSGGGQGITGFVNGYRVTIGHPRWTADFTPPNTLAQYAPPP